MKYFKVEWPWYQELLEDPNIERLAIYSADKDCYFVPENLLYETN